MNQPPTPTPEEINLRAAADPQKSCATCANFDAQSKLCSVLQQQVDPTMVSDSYQPQGQQMPQGQPDMEDMLFKGPPQNG